MHDNFTSPRRTAWHPYTLQVPPTRNIRDYYCRGTTAHAWLNHIVYPPKTPEMLILSTITIALATFLIETLNEKPNGQVSIVVVSILNQLQNLTPAILALEGNDNSTANCPTWLKSKTLSLVESQRNNFLKTLDFILRQLLEIPMFTSSFTTKSVSNAYYTLISDFKNAAHMLTTNKEAAFVIPSDTKTRRDISRYLTSMEVTEIDIKLHEELDSQKEMVMCIHLGLVPEGRAALRTFGMLAAAHVRERSPPEADPPRELLIWLALQATGIHQRVQADFHPIYVDMLRHDKVLGAQRRFPNVRTLRTWAQNHGQSQILADIDLRLTLPRYNLGRRTNAAQTPPVNLAGMTSSPQAAARAINAFNHTTLLERRRAPILRQVMTLSPQENQRARQHPRRTEDPSGPAPTSGTRKRGLEPPRSPHRAAPREQGTPRPPPLQKFPPTRTPGQSPQRQSPSPPPLVIASPPPISIPDPQTARHPRTRQASPREAQAPPRPPTASPPAGIRGAPLPGLKPFTVPKEERHGSGEEATLNSRSPTPPAFHLPTTTTLQPPQAHSANLVLAVTDAGETWNALDLVVRFNRPQGSPGNPGSPSKPTRAEP